MKRLVVDASVLLKLFFEEEHSEAAEACLARAEKLLAPDLIWVEAGNVVWKKQARGEYSSNSALSLFRQILASRIAICPSVELAQEALELAMQFRRSVYDSLYLALAVKTNSMMVTADKRLVNALAGGPLEKHVAWIGKA
jgi:predicted nucleic acid-binding protein